jgi:hypothetical protein
MELELAASLECGGGAAMAKKLGEYLAVAPQSSRDQKLLFFSMVEYHRFKRSEVQKPVAAHG